jgi:hypothetical protein
MTNSTELLQKLQTPSNNKTGAATGCGRLALTAPTGKHGAARIGVKRPIVQAEVDA